MKRLILTILILVLSISVANAQSVGQVAKGLKPDGTYAPILLDANGKLITNAESTGGGSTGTWTLVLPAIYDSISYSTVLATGTRKLLTEIASFSDGDLIMFQGQNTVRWDFGTKDVTTLQNYGLYADGKGLPIQCHMRTGWNMSFVADATGGISTMTVVVCRER